MQLVEYLGQMMVRAKCAPAFMRLVHERAPDSPILQYATRCPCGVQYCRITPDGHLTACPYLPVSAGDLRRQPFAEVWRSASLFHDLREGNLGGKCGRCGYRGPREKFRYYRCPACGHRSDIGAKIFGPLLAFVAFFVILYLAFALGR